MGMMEYYLKIGNSVVLSCKDTDEAVIFDSFGNFKEQKSFREGIAVGGTRIPQEAVLCSIAGKTPNIDVYVNGKRYLTQGNVSNISIAIRKAFMRDMMDVIPYKLMGTGNVPITIFVFKKGEYVERLKSVLGVPSNACFVDV